MSKYNALWDFVAGKDLPQFSLTFEEIEKTLGFPIDHSFLKYKRELIAYGYAVKKISMKDKFIEFAREK